MPSHGSGGHPGFNRSSNQGVKRVKENVSDIDCSLYKLFSLCFVKYISYAAEFSLFCVMYSIEGDEVPEAGYPGKVSHLSLLDDERVVFTTLNVMGSQSVLHQGCLHTDSGHISVK